MTVQAFLMVRMGLTERRMELVSTGESAEHVGG